MPRYIFLAIFIVFALFSCSEKEEVQVYEELLFNVDTSLLGKKVSIRSAGLEFFAPKGYEQMDDQLFQNLKQSLLNVEGFRHFPMLAAINESQRGILLFLKLFPQDSTTQHITFDHVENVLQPKDTNVKVNKHFFRKDSIDILQYIVDTGQILDFKLFFHDKDSNLYEIDYIFLTKDEYRENSRAIESSIGSLKFH
jgi:hypothetical protein